VPLIADQYYKKNGCHFKKKMTTGWELEVEWRDGSSSWLPLKMLKETNPVQVADYAHGNKIDMEPAFDRWVPMVLQLCNWTTKHAVNWHHCIGYKYGIPLPSSVADAEHLDKINGNMLWMDTLHKEMEQCISHLKCKMNLSCTFLGIRRYCGMWFGT